MADNTGIEWTDATWQPITGCSVVSPGCTNCYAMRLAGTRLREHPSRAGLTTMSKAGPVWNGQVRFNEQWLDQPLRWKRSRRIFVCAHGDLFHESIPDAWIDRVFAVMALCPQHTFQILTKRSWRMREYCGDIEGSYNIATAILDLLIDRKIDGKITDESNPLADERADDDPALKKWPLPNVWLGVSAEDQARADERIPDLLAIPAAVRFVSAEPLLSALDLVPYLSPHFQSESADFPKLGELDWVIAGGESGPSARPMHPDWARSIRDQCQDARVPFFFKQWGQWAPWDDDNWSLPDGWDDVEAHDKAITIDGVEFLSVGKRRAGRLLDGREWREFPK